MTNTLFFVSANEADDLFDRSFNDLKKRFSEQGDFVLVRGESYSECNWPKGVGVYVIRIQQRPLSCLIYIGMTGKVNTDGGLGTAQTFANRAARYTPYWFDREKNLFCFNPKAPKSKDLDSSDYNDSIELKYLEVDCFICRPGVGHSLLAPSYLEAFLLQAFLMQTGRLPKANRSF